MNSKIIDFFTCIQKSTWQEIVYTVILIPILFWLYGQLKRIIIDKRPVNNLLKGFRKSENEVLIFLSQLSPVNAHGTIINQPFIAQYPNPTLDNPNNLAKASYGNINVVWTQSDGRCANDVFNILGRVGRTKNFKIADLICDWNKQNSPIFSVGFNPKTRDLIKHSNPINFKLLNGDTVLAIDGHTQQLGSNYPADAGIIQKTFLASSKMPVIILAGLGITGTEAAGNVLIENCVWLGKLYGNRPFTVLFSTDITKGGEYYILNGSYPMPKWWRVGIFPFTAYRRRKLFPK